MVLYLDIHVDVSKEPTDRMLDKIDSDLLPNIDFMEMMELLHIPKGECERFLDKINRAKLPAIICAWQWYNNMVLWTRQVNKYWTKLIRRSSHILIAQASWQWCNYMTFRRKQVNKYGEKNNSVELLSMDSPSFMMQLLHVLKEAKDQILDKHIGLRCHISIPQLFNEHKNPHFDKY